MTWWEGLFSPWVSKSWDDRGDPDLAPKRLRHYEQVICIVLHTTGYGTGLGALDDKYLDQLRVDLEYARRLHRILKYKGSFLVGRTGAVFQMAPLCFTSWHSSSAQVSQLEVGAQLMKNRQWWFDANPGLDTPLDLPAWRPIKKAASINTRSVGIDFLAPKPGDVYFEEQIRSGARLVAELCTMLDIPNDTRHVTDHSTVHPGDLPAGRGKPSGPWDFDSRFPWTRFREHVANALGSSESGL